MCSRSRSPPSLPSIIFYTVNAIRCIYNIHHIQCSTWIILRGLLISVAFEVSGAAYVVGKDSPVAELLEGLDGTGVERFQDVLHSEFASNVFPLFSRPFLKIPETSTFSPSEFFWCRKLYSIYILNACVFI